MIPWADLHNSTEQLIAPEYLPNEFNIKDPSKMITDKVDALISHWCERSELGLVPLEFQAYKTKQGDIVECAVPEILLDDLIAMKGLDQDDLEGECIWNG